MWADLGFLTAWLPGEVTLLMQSKAESLHLVT